jgi:KDO2-lipid IV(A) lauroyltransferase
LYAIGKSAVIVQAHYGNWEWAGMGLDLVAPHKTIAVYKPLNNTKIDRIVKKMRGKFGIELVEMKRAPRRILKQTEPTLSILIADQTPFRTDIEYKTQFLNQLTPVFLGPEKIAKFAKQDVLYLHSKRIKRGHYEIELIPVSKASDELALFEITNRHLKILEDIIKEKPADWLWSHRRWKYQNHK